MYILALRNTQFGLDGNAYTQLRKLLDVNMNGIFRWVMYSALMTSLLWCLANLGSPASLTFITAVISLIALVTDTILAVKRSIPLNRIINSWSPSQLPEDWKEIRASWLYVFQFRQIANILGFISLLIGVVWRMD
jgi:hypothetical protein